MSDRLCSKVGCSALATATLTSDYAGTTVVIGPLSVDPDPVAYDLCAAHALSMRAPHGWTVIRHVSLRSDDPLISNQSA